MTKLVFKAKDFHVVCACQGLDIFKSLLDISKKVLELMQLRLFSHFPPPPKWANLLSGYKFELCATYQMRSLVILMHSIKVPTKKYRT